MTGAAKDHPEKTGRQRRGGPPETLFGPGNPGRPKGARNKTTVMVEAMIEGEAEALTQTAISLALKGDATLLRVLLDRLAPPRRDRAVAVDLPKITKAADAPAIAAALLEKAAAGELTTTEAQGMAGLLEAYRRQSELADLEARLAALEAAHAAQR